MRRAAPRLGDDLAKLTILALASAWAGAVSGAAILAAAINPAHVLRYLREG